MRLLSQETKAKSNARVREWKRKNKEKTLAGQALYREKNREELKRKGKEYHERNKEVRQAYYKEYRETNVQKEKERHKRYYEENKAKVQATTHNCRIKKKQNDPQVFHEHQKALTQSRKKNKPWLFLYHWAKERAKKYGLEFTITKEMLELRWTGRCELTNIEFKLDGNRNDRLYSPSLDRIDSAKGYTEDNVRLVLTAINLFKNSGSDKDIYHIARALIENEEPDSV